MQSPPDENATILLQRLSGGDESAAQQLMPLVYDELRALAQRFFQMERANHTLEPTALVHEAFLRLIDQDRANYQNKSHFLAMAATAMRRVLTDYARRHLAAKRGGGMQRVPLTNVMTPTGGAAINLVTLDDLLSQLAGLDARQHRIVELRFFSGLAVDDVADLLDISKSTVEREWRMAKAWLSTELRKADSP